MKPPWWKAPRRALASALATDELRRFMLGENEPVTGVDPALATSEPVIGIAHQGVMHLVPVEPITLLATDEVQAQLEQLLSKAVANTMVLPPGPRVAKTAAAIASEIIERHTGQKPLLYTSGLYIGGHNQKPVEPIEPIIGKNREAYLTELRAAFAMGTALGPNAHVNCISSLTPVEPSRTATQQFADKVREIGAASNLGPAEITFYQSMMHDRVELQISWPQAPDVDRFEYEISRLALANDQQGSIRHVLRAVRFHVEVAAVKPPPRTGWEDRPLDMATTVIGYRAFALRAPWQADTPTFVLTSSGQGHGTEWKAGQDLQAKCLYHRHPAPAPNCHCGFNCFHRLSHLFEKPDTWGNIGAIDAIGVVQAWGAIEAHKEGFRAEHVRPLALLRFPEHARVESQGGMHGRVGDTAVLEAAVAASGLPVWDALDHRDQLEEFGEAIPTTLLPEPDVDAPRGGPSALPTATFYLAPVGTVMTSCPRCCAPWTRPVEIDLNEVLVHCPDCPAPIRIRGVTVHGPS